MCIAVLVVAVGVVGVCGSGDADDEAVKGDSDRRGPSRPQRNSSHSRIT